MQHSFVCTIFKNMVRLGKHNVLVVEQGLLCEFTTRYGTIASWSCLATTIILYEQCSVAYFKRKTFDKLLSAVFLLSGYLLWKGGGMLALLGAECVSPLDHTLRKVCSAWFLVK